MAARRCVLHGSYPNEYRFHKCPVCSEPTYYIMDGEPDEYWEQNIARHLERYERGETVAPDVPVLEGAKVVVENGQYFISTHDVVNGGVSHRLSDTDLVQVGKQVFEILHYSYEKRRYLVQPFSVALSDDDLTELVGS